MSCAPVMDRYPTLAAQVRLRFNPCTVSGVFYALKAAGGAGFMERKSAQFIGIRGLMLVLWSARDQPAGEGRHHDDFHRGCLSQPCRTDLRRYPQMR